MSQTSNGHGTSSLPQEDRALLASVDKYLADALALKSWWARAHESNAYHRFELERTFHRPAYSYGFFGQAQVGGRTLPVMGNVQDMFYDQPKIQAQKEEGALWMREQLREFVLRYFMRVSSFRQPEVFISGDHPEPDPLLRSLSWCPEPRTTRQGFGFAQLYYKTPDGNIGRFEDPWAIIDLREIGSKYEWILLKVKIFNFAFKTWPLGASGPEIAFNLDEQSYLVVHRDFIVNQEAPKPGMLGRYGIGYGFIKNPASHLLAYGPGEFDAAFETIEFSVDNKGNIRVHMVFVANRPARIANISLAPIRWALRAAELLSAGAASSLLEAVGNTLKSVDLSLGNFDPVLSYVSLLNLATGGYAARELCITKERLEKIFLLQHFLQHYETVSGSLFTWRQIGDWLDRSTLPEWVVTGRSS